MESRTIACKYCGSPNIIKFGSFEGVQRYFCKDCQRKFADNAALPHMKTSAKAVSSALSCYFGGMPLDAIQRHLNQQYGVYMSESGIYNWVVRFAREAVDRTKDFKPKVGDTWIADETVLKVGGKNIWFWDVIDADSRYLLASRLSTTRTTKDAALVMKQAANRAGKTPKRVITDRLAAYIDGIELVFGADTEHVRSKPFVDIDSTNRIERFHGTLKARTYVIRGFKNMETAKLLTDAWLVYYNMFKEHESLGNVPPAVKMGIELPFKDWAEVVGGTVIPSRRQPISRPKQTRKSKPKGRKRSHPVAGVSTLR